MMKRIPIIVAGAMLCLLTMPAMATAVRHMNLDTLTQSAGVIFRGTVVSIDSGSTNVGGKEMPTTTYAFRVDEMFKGAPSATKNGEQFLTVTMVGSIKDSAPEGDLMRFNVFRDVPRLRQGEEYLLFNTQPSGVGLSVTVGLAQGCFDINGGMALNRAGNLGLFKDTAYAGPSQGPIEYRELAARIRATLSTQ